MSRMKIQQHFKNVSDNGFNPDWVLISIVSGLMCLGLLMVLSSTIAISDIQAGQSNFRHATSQLIYMIIGTFILLFAWSIPTEWWRSTSKMTLVIGYLLLISVLIPGIGIEVNGSNRWLPFGPVRLQPSELVKIIMIIYMADFLNRMGDRIQSLLIGIVSPGLVVGLAGFLLMMQPDFGTTVVILLTMGLMLFMGGIRITHCIMICGIGAGLISVLAFSSSYRVLRMMSFRDPWADPFNSGFQLVQALIAVGRGELVGVGLGNSIQKLYYLPHAHNDFILAVIGEELGFLGIALVLLLFGALIIRIFKIAREAEIAKLYFGARVAQGVATIIALQATINIGVNLGALPTKGLTLPFISYGGSSIIAHCLMIGMVLAIHQQTQAVSPRINHKSNDLSEGLLRS